MRVLRSRGSDLERDFAFGVARQIFEPPLAAASNAERTEVLQAAAGVGKKASKKDPPEPTQVSVATKKARAPYSSPDGL